jgi:hypothetical protein
VLFACPGLYGSITGKAIFFIGGARFAESCLPMQVWALVAASRVQLKSLISQIAYSMVSSETIPLR